MKTVHLLFCALSLVGCDNSPASQHNTDHTPAQASLSSQSILSKGKFDCEPVINPDYNSNDGRKEWLLPMECEKNPTYYSQYHDVSDKYYTYRQPYNASPPSAYTVAEGATGVLTGASALAATKIYQKYLAQKKVKSTADISGNAITNNKVSVTKNQPVSKKAVSQHH